MPTKYPDVDLIVVRENTEGLYSGIEHEVVPGVVESLKIITEKASTRISQFAFEYARKFKRKKIHAIHKANIMKMSDGLFIRCSRNVSKEYPEITYGEHIVDNTCMQLVMNPYQYDVLLLENLYGDIISDLCAAFVGGLGLGCGRKLRHDCAIFEAVHGSAPDIAGKDMANPTAVLRSGVLMLQHLGEHDCGQPYRCCAGECVHREKACDARCRRNGRHHRVCRRRDRSAAHDSGARASGERSGAVTRRIVMPIRVHVPLQSSFPIVHSVDRASCSKPTAPISQSAPVAHTPLDAYRPCNRRIHQRNRASSPVCPQRRRKSTCRPIRAAKARTSRRRLSSMTATWRTCWSM